MYTQPTCVNVSRFWKTTNFPIDHFVLVSWVLWHFLTSQVISVALYIECEKSDEFCSGSFGLRFLRHRTNSFTSLPKEVILRIFKLWKNPSTLAGFEPENLESSSEYDNHRTTGVDFLCKYSGSRDFHHHPFSCPWLRRSSIRYPPPMFSIIP